MRSSSPLPALRRPAALRSSALATIALAGGLLAAAPAADARVVAVADGSARLQLRDLRTMRTTTSVRLPGGSRAVGFASDGSRLFSAAGRQVVAVDPTNGQITARANAGLTPQALAVASTGSRVLVGGGRTLAVLDATTLATVARIQLDAKTSVSGLAVDDAGTRAIVALGKHGAAVVDLARGRIIRRLRLGTPAASPSAPTARPRWSRPPAAAAAAAR